jgi:broad specificity phosphatase PhoE
VGAAVEVEPAVLDDLIESARGEWEGRPQTVLAQDSPELFAAFEAGDPGFVFPGGESIRSQVLRTDESRQCFARTSPDSASHGRVQTVLRTDESKIMKGPLRRGGSPRTPALSAGSE